MKQRVLVTGAAGTVGSTLWKAWEKQNAYNLILMDINPIECSTSQVVQADIRDYEAIQSLCQKQDVLVHLAYLRQDSPPKVTGELSDIGVSMMDLFNILSLMVVQRILVHISRVTLTLVMLRRC